MGKKKGKEKGASKSAKDEAPTVALTKEEFIATTLLRILESDDKDTAEMAATGLCESLSDLVTAKQNGQFQNTLDQLLEGFGMPCGDKLQAVAFALQTYQLGLANPVARCETSVGTFEAEIFLDKMPITSSNFVDLASNGFYDGLHFHRIVPNFMVQFGCPISRDPKKPAGEGAPDPGSVFTVVGSDDTVTRGTKGDESGCIPDELDAKISNDKFTLAMANNDAPNTGGSQFFVNTKDNHMLDHWNDESESKHPVFGKVISGEDVVLKIEKTNITEEGCPVKPIKMKSIKIV